MNLEPYGSMIPINHPIFKGLAVFGSFTAFKVLIAPGLQNYKFHFSLLTDWLLKKFRALNSLLVFTLS